MADKKEIILTVDGKAELEAELEQLVTVTRKEVAEKIKEARSFGDLSENAEYDAAKDEQAEVEARISQIEYQLKHAKVLEIESNDIVTVGKVVTVEFFGEVAESMGMAGEKTFMLVGSSEADPTQDKLSYESPIGAACNNQAVGSEVVALSPAGEVQIKVLNIEKAK